MPLKCQLNSVSFIIWLQNCTLELSEESLEAKSVLQVFRVFLQFSNIWPPVHYTDIPIIKVIQMEVGPQINNQMKRLKITQYFSFCTWEKWSMVIRGFAENTRFAFSDLIKKTLNFCITQTYNTRFSKN